MPRKRWYVIPIFFIVLIIFSCASSQTPQRLSVSQLSSTQYTPKVDNFMFILDASSSMEISHSGYKRFDIAKNIIYHISEMLPDIPLNGALRSLGHSSAVSEDKTKLFYGIKPFNITDFQKQMDMITKPGGTSPLAHAIGASHKDLEGIRGKVALIIVSDGADMDDTPLEQADHMIEKMKDRLCIYTIQVGDDPMGKTLLERIALQSNCGKYIHANMLSSSSGLKKFVEEVFLKKQKDSDGDGVTDDQDQCPGSQKNVRVNDMGCSLDADGDGVDDDMDKCPNTPVGTSVNKNGCSKDADGDGVLDVKDECPGTAKGIAVDLKGCPVAATKSAKVTAAGTWLYEAIQFASGKSSISSQSIPTLNEISQFLTNNPNIKVEIQGHTDSKGRRTYNHQLSEKRAQAVRNYLIGTGVAAGRLKARGYGSDIPIATNTTSFGRKRNRRVELKPIE